MGTVKQFVKDRRTVKWLLIALIALYPLVHAFLGMDLGDTGYHLYAYTNLTANPDKINYTTFLSSVIGFIWNKLFGWMGLVGFNLLEVLLEWCLVFVVYFTLKDDLGEINVLAGSLFAVICAGTYLNIFNYHQLNAFLLTLILCLEYKAIIGDKKMLSLLAGIVYVLVVFSRVGSVIAVVTLCLYIYYAVMYDYSWKETGKHLLAFALGAGAFGLFLLLGLKVTGRLDYFVSNIFRLGGIAADETSSYGFMNLLTLLIQDNLKVIGSGLVFYGALAILIAAMNTILGKCENKLKKLCHVLLGVFLLGVGIYQMQFAYDVNPAENWPQMTTGQRYLLGVMYVTAFICFIYYAFKKDMRSRKLSLIVVAACMLVVLTIAGSNTATKHVILAMWLLGPVCVYTARNMLGSPKTVAVIRKAMEKMGVLLHPWTLRAAVAVALIMFFYKFGHMTYYTFNYDCVDRTKLTATVDNNKVRGILTTQRQADALNGVLETLDDYHANQPLMVFGNSLLLYYMTERPAYGMPWVTQSSYPVEKLEVDMKRAAEVNGNTLPLVVYCRTNYAYGFAEADLEWAQAEVTLNAYSGKKEFILEFLKDHNYGVVYMNDYYAVFVPESATQTVALENLMFGRIVEE